MSLRDLEAAGFDIRARNHAEAVLIEDFPEPLRELCDVMSDFRIEDVGLIRAGGGEASSAQRLRRAFAERGCHKRNIEIQKIVDGEPRAGTTHEIDHVRQSAKGQSPWRLNGITRTHSLIEIWRTFRDCTPKVL